MARKLYVRRPLLAAAMAATHMVRRVMFAERMLMRLHENAEVAQLSNKRIVYSTNASDEQRGAPKILNSSNARLKNLLSYRSALALRRRALNLACTLLVAAAVHCHAETIEGLVVRVADGDTITVLDADKVLHKIRLAGIDAPERTQPFGQRSKNSLSDLVFSKSVTIDTNKRDRYGREVGKVIVDGLDANLEQVKRGMAWHYKAYEREQSRSDQITYSTAEVVARRDRQGLWSDLSPEPPWYFRRK